MRLLRAWFHSVHWVDYLVGVAAGVLIGYVWWGLQ